MIYYSFKTKDTKGCPCRTYVTRDDDGNTYIFQRGFIQPEHKDKYKVLRKWKDMYYCENYVGLKPTSLGHVLEIIANKLPANETI